MPNFIDIGNRKLEEIERPKNPPVGNYLWFVSKVPESSTLPGDEWDVVDFICRAKAPVDVDSDALSDWGGDITKVSIRHRFMFDKKDPVRFEQTLFRLKTFLNDHLKVSADLGMSEALNASVNAQFIGEITWQKDKREEGLYHTNMGKTAPVE